MIFDINLFRKTTHCIDLNQFLDIIFKSHSVRQMCEKSNRSIQHGAGNWAIEAKLRDYNKGLNKGEIFQ